MADNPESEDETEQLRATVLETATTIRLAKDGRRLNVSITVSPIKDFAGHVVGASKVARDITQRKAAEQAAEEANREGLHPSSCLMFSNGLSRGIHRQLVGMVGWGSGWLLLSSWSNCMAATSASEAMERILARRPHVLIYDIAMPGEDGYSFIRRLRILEESQESSLPALALSAYAGSEDRTKAIRSGFQNHLAKPVEPAELLAVVSSLTARKSAIPFDVE
jgi:CheY-like chemotaxis protein